MQPLKTFKKLLSSPLFSAKNITILAGVTCLIFAIVGSIVSVVRFWQFDVFYYDFGIFDHAIWQVAHFKPPVMEHFIYEGKWIFADHFSPAIFFLSPLYWFIHKSEGILIAQAVIVGASGFVLYLIGKEVTRRPLIAFFILLLYFLFVGLQNAIISDFHEMTVATLPFLLTYYFFIKKRVSLFFLFLAITLGFKESNFLLGIALGISLFLLDRKQWKIGLLTCIFSLLYGIFVMKFVIPYFSGGIYGYGVSPTLNPFAYIHSLTDNELKRSTLFFSFASFGFLPLLSPAFYVLLLEDFVSRFYPPFLSISWGLGLHYSAMTAAIMGVASLQSVATLKKFLKKPVLFYGLCVVIFLYAGFLYRFTLRGPFGLVYNPAFYVHTKDFAFLERLVSQVPKDASVMTQNNLAVRFTHQNVWLLRSKCKSCVNEHYNSIMPEYIVLDMRSGQNANNFYGVSDMEPILASLLKDPNYHIFYHEGRQYIFQKKKL